MNKRVIDRRIAGLAFPALGALIAEPIFLAIDSALVGHLGAVPLAGLAIASTVLSTAIGLMIFLAYSTTPLVARRRGAGDLRGAVQAGVDGLWLAFGIGVVVAVILWFLQGKFVAAFRPDSDVAVQAEIYLGISALGVPAMLLVFAAMGLLRGMQDTVTPLYVATIGFGVNALLSFWLIYGLDMGIAGSAWGTVIAQWGMALVYLVIAWWHAKKHGASLLPEREGFKHAGSSGGWLFIRSLGLRAALIVTVAAAATHGAAATAGYQIIFILVSMTAFGLDALAIAAQALVGDALGARDADRARAVLNRTLFWGVIVGAILGILLAALSPVIGYIFTTDVSVLSLLTPAIVAVGLTLPLSAVVYVLDGVLMGADDMKFLAVMMTLAALIYLPALWVTTVLVPSGSAALVAITLAFTLLLMLLRGLPLWFRVRGSKWITLGAGAK